MPAPRLPSSEQLDALRRTFSERAPSSVADFASAAAFARCTIGQARFAWSSGWPDANIVPLEVELGSTGERTRAAGVAIASAELVAGEALARAAALGEYVRRLVPIAGRLVGALESDESLAAMPAPLALASLRQVVAVLGRAATIDAEAVELKQLVDGKAQRIVAHIEAPRGAVSADDAIERAEFVIRAARRAKAKELEATPTPTESDDEPSTVH